MVLRREHKLKILAFVISATLWYLVVWGKPIEKVIEIPVKFKNTHGKEYFVEANPSSIAIKITATRSQLRNIEKDKFEVEIDLEKYPPGIHQVRIPVEKINLPPTIKVKEISPVFLTVIIKKISQKQVPVRVSFSEGHDKESQTLKVIIKPSVVYVRGFWEEIKDIEEIYTEDIDPAYLKNNKVIEVKFKVPAKVLEVQPNSVKIVYLNK